MHIVGRRGHRIKSINRLVIIASLTSLGLAAVSTIWALYLESFLKNQSYVGYLSSFFTIIGLLSYFFLIPIIEKRNKAVLYAFALIIYVFSYFAFAFLNNIWLVVLLGMVLAVFASLRITTFGIMVRDKSSDKSLSENEGEIYTSFNIAWLIGPLLAGFLAQRYGLNKVFLMAAFFMALSLTLFIIFKMNDSRTEKKIDKSTIKVIKEYFKSKDRTISYIIGGGISFWWAFIYIYMPIHIVESGLSDLVVGYFLFGVIFPLILLEYYFGKRASKKGFRKIFILGYAILALISFVCFFIANIYFLLIALVIGSVGISMLEPTAEAYFFDIISKQQRDKFYGIYNTTIEVHYTLSTAITATILMFLPFKFVFLFFGVIMLFFALLAISTRNIIEGRKD